MVFKNELPQEFLVYGINVLVGVEADGIGKVYMSQESS